MATKIALTLEEFLALPETEPPSEYIDGEVVQKVSPSWYHALVTHRLNFLLGLYLASHSQEAIVANELRHASSSGTGRVYIPDISVFSWANIPDDDETHRGGPVGTAPDLAVEVLSPGDSVGRVLEKADFYMQVGTSLLWIIDPELQTITVYRPGKAPEVFKSPATLDASPVLPSFALPLESLFGTLPGGMDSDS